MPKLRFALVVVTIVLSQFANGSSAQQATPPHEENGCPLEIAVQQVDQFIQNRTVEMATAVKPLLNELNTISAKAKRPGIAIGKQLSPEDIERFNTIRHLLGPVYKVARRRHRRMVAI